MLILSNVATSSLQNCSIPHNGGGEIDCSHDHCNPINTNIVLFWIKCAVFFNAGSSKMGFLVKIWTVAGNQSGSSPANGLISLTHSTSNAGKGKVVQLGLRGKVTGHQAGWRVGLSKLIHKAMVGWPLGSFRFLHLTVKTWVHPGVFILHCPLSAQLSS